MQNKRYKRAEPRLLLVYKILQVKKRLSETYIKLTNAQKMFIW